MLHSLLENEASLKLAVSYPEFPGNRSSRVSAAEKTRSQGMKEVIEDPMFWEMVRDIKRFTQPASDVNCHAGLNFCLT